MPESEICEIKGCRRIFGIIYLKKKVCDYHWSKLAETPDKLRNLLGLPPMQTTKYAIPVGEVNLVQETEITPKQEYENRKELAMKTKKPKEEVSENIVTIQTETIELDSPVQEFIVEETKSSTEESRDSSKEYKVSETTQVVKDACPAGVVGRTIKSAKRGSAKNGRCPKCGLSITKDGFHRHPRNDVGKSRGKKA
jgi:hypothetical protein